MRFFIIIILVFISTQAHANKIKNHIGTIWEINTISRNFLEDPENYDRYVIKIKMEVF